MKRKIFLSIVFLLMGIHAHGDTLVLKSGKILEGKVVKEATHYISFKVSATNKTEDFLRENIENLSTNNQANISFELQEENAGEQGLPAKNEKIEDGDALRPLSSRDQVSRQSNVLRIYGTEILDENASMQGYEKFSEEPVFYVKNEKDSWQNLILKWIEENSQSSFFWVAVAAGLFLLYLLALYPFYLIAVKTNTPHSYFAWIPILNIYLLLRIAGRPGWWLILLMVPVVNLIILTMIWMDIASACGKPAWVGFLIWAPVVNFFMPWYLALCQDAIDTNSSKGKKVPVIDEEKEKHAQEQALFDQIVPSKPSNKPTRF